MLKSGQNTTKDYSLFLSITPYFFFENWVILLFPGDIAAIK